ncbi:MAG: hypothetical protein ACJAVV_003145 [Alphaproteobacteria bacterium]
MSAIVFEIQTRKQKNYMNQFEYLIQFVGIIYALSATDLLVSVHRLIIERKNLPFIWSRLFGG